MNIDRIAKISRVSFALGLSCSRPISDGNILKEGHAIGLRRTTEWIAKAFATS